MIRLFLKLVVLLIIIAVVGIVIVEWRPEGGWLTEPASGRTVEAPNIDTSRAREVGTQLGNKAAEAAAQAQAALADGSITAKIKAKMALDDTIDASDVHVTFDKGVVTLTGTVKTQPERKRAVDLARETEGVTSVRDRLVMPER
jgi:hyperosmotically inducible protein